MKKIISVCFSAALILSLAACGAQKQPQTQLETQSGTEAQTETQAAARPQTQAAAHTQIQVETQAAAGGNSAAKKGDEAKVDELKKNFLAKADEVEVSENSVTFTDASGRGKITIQKNPQKAAGLYGSYNALWYEAGGKLAGCVGGSAVDVYTAQIGRDITKDQGMTVIATSNAASKWSVEEIINFNPDLIFCGLSMKGYGTIGKAAEATNIPVIAVDYNDFSDYLKWFKVFCNINDRADLWETVAMKNLDEVINVILQVPADKAPQIASLFDINEANLSGTLMGQMIDQLGGVNIADSLNKSGEMTRMEIDLESIYGADPEAIIIQCHGDPSLTEAKFKKAFDGNPVWEALSAVKNNRVYYMDDMLFHIKPNKRFSEAYLKLAQVMYPDHEFVLNDK